MIILLVYVVPLLLCFTLIKIMNAYYKSMAPPRYYIGLSLVPIANILIFVILIIGCAIIVTSENNIFNNKFVRWLENE